MQQRQIRRSYPRHHEQSETFEVDGGYGNFYGAKTPNAGKPLPIHYPSFEKDVYPNEQEAIGSAILRSELEGRRMQPMMEAYPEQFGQFEVLERRRPMASGSPIQGRAEEFRQGGMEDLGPSRNPMSRRGGAIRQKLQRARELMRQMAPGPDMNAPMSGR